jgi:uncharacterized protein (DUF952 family)
MLALALGPEPDPYRVALLRSAVDPLAPPGGPRALVVDGPVVAGPVAGPAAGVAGVAVRRPGHLFGADLVELVLVDGRRRRQGVGLALLRAAAAESGPAPVWTTAGRGNAAMRALLAADGWTVAGGLAAPPAADAELLFRRPGDREGRPGVLYHLALREDWERAVRSGAYRVSTLGATLSEVGFIHSAFAHQVAGVAGRYYAAERRPLVLLEIARARLVPPVRIEPAGDDAFPHLYGPLDPAAVTAVHPVGRDLTGRLLLPVE